jgi:protein O-GlcNAc transferase
MRQPIAPELRLLLACARAHTSAENEAAIRRLLNENTDWTRFVQKAVAHGLAGLAGQTLTRRASDLVPEDILGAFKTFIEQTRDGNQILLDELASLIEQLTAAGVKAIPFKGPVLAQQAFGDLALRGFRDLDLLIRDRDMPQTIKTLLADGYTRQGKLTDVQFDLVHWLQGQEILFKDEGAVEPHTRLTSVKTALDIDYEGLWRRARQEQIFGHDMLTFSPEDTLLVLAIHGGKELWWSIKWACDIADFIASHPNLDWDAIAARARSQGCHRMLLVATALARNYLGSTRIPPFLAAAENNDPAVSEIIGRIVTRWEAEDPGGPPSNKTLSRDRLLLHDGAARQALYALRTIFLPGPHHIPLVALPRWLSFAYIPFGLAHDLIALPLYRAYEVLAQRTDRVLMESPLALALAPVGGETRKKLKRLQQGYLKARQAVTAEPCSHLSWLTMGDALTAMKRHESAVAAYDKALGLMPDNKTLWHKRSATISVLQKTGRFPNLSKAPQFDDKDPDGWALQAGFLSSLGRHAEAAQASERAVQLDPGHVTATRIGIHSRIFACDWSNRDEDKRMAREGFESNKFSLRPFTLKLISDSERDCLASTLLWTKDAKWSGAPLWKGERYRHDRIRIAYLSTDFRAHPVGTTMVAPLELHDKNRFEITAVSLHPGDASEVRPRIKAVVDRFVDAHLMGDGTIAALLRELEIDIAVDLNGHTGSKRHGVLMRRPAPLQVNYLGYPGTMAAPFIDYIIADKTVIPEINKAFYTEKVAYLPDAYLPHDRQRLISEIPLSRSEEGLPEAGFVFASFNSLHKFSPEVFEIWMRLLKTIEESVLWVPGANSPASASLRREAVARGVAPERIVFARYVKSSADHLARQRLADLFLDTLPYNAHSTAADALWAGLPVLTCMGQAFQSRVAAGLLQAVDIPELITTSLTEYEQKALSLAQNRTQMAAIREKLARNRDGAALFDVARFTRGLEAVYTTMWERQQDGLPPESFSVAAP